MGIPCLCPRIRKAAPDESTRDRCQYHRQHYAVYMRATVTGKKVGNIGGTGTDDYNGTPIVEAVDCFVDLLDAADQGKKDR